MSRGMWIVVLVAAVVSWLAAIVGIVSASHNSAQVMFFLLMMVFAGLAGVAAGRLL